MQPFARFAAAWAINALALYVANGLFAGVVIHGAAAYLIGAAVLAVANAVLKPVLALLTFPLILVTFGFFYLVINIAMVALAEWVAPNFTVDVFDPNARSSGAVTRVTLAFACFSIFAYATCDTGVAAACATAVPPAANQAAASQPITRLDSIPRPLPRRRQRSIGR